VVVVVVVMVVAVVVVAAVCVVRTVYSGVYYKYYGACVIIIVINRIPRSYRIDHSGSQLPRRDSRAKKGTGPHSIGEKNENIFIVVFEL